MWNCSGKKMPDEEKIKIKRHLYFQSKLVCVVPFSTLLFTFFRYCFAVIFQYFQQRSSMHCSNNKSFRMKKENTCSAYYIIQRASKYHYIEWCYIQFPLYIYRQMHRLCMRIEYTSIQKHE